MASELDVLLDKVEDPTLRADLKRQVELLRSRRRFGLVFEEHLPERVQLPEHAIRRGTRVVLRDYDDDEPREVIKVAKKKATVRSADGETETLAVDDLVVVADFGEPIYPGLRRLGSLKAGGDKPAHVVIKGENHHVLEALQFTHAGKVDCVYIDPPYNTGARDWKYGNDYVDKDDAYRHSKWLAFMERRLKLAKALLNPEEAVLIVTIDEKEYLRLGLLLDRVFAGSAIQMVSIQNNPSGVARLGEFRRSDEYAFFVRIGRQVVSPVVLGAGWSDVETSRPRQLDWNKLRRTGTNTQRADRPNLFYPLFIDEEAGRIAGVGDPLPLTAPRSEVEAPSGTLVVWPIREDGSEGNWQVQSETLRANLEKGYVRLGGKSAQGYAVYYLKAGEQRRLEAGEYLITGHRKDGSILVETGTVGVEGSVPTTQWSNPSHDAATHGSRLLRSLVPGRSFPFPKSLYAVEDCLRFFVASKPEAVILDFFAGSGTTAHGVARLNRQDGGRRQSISVTNNEVSESEARELHARGLRPGQEEWEALGIFEHVTRPRITAAITGLTPEGEPVKGDYRFVDEFPMAEGLNENVEFFELTYLDPEDVEISAAFEGVAPMLWLRAGGRGEMIEHDAPCYAVMDTYGVLFNPDRWRKFVSDLHEDVRTVFIVTDSPSIFAAVAAELPAGVKAVRLYENYFTTFALHTRRTMPAEVVE
ncbi:MAG: site-specific DNA-methyltransferase [Actinomycetota bacterium]|nr:site-specific DNA-methyltransferase [Actinomycetota bacterium]MDQ3640726.1 site-specific DNA-methyltransferase [Actinomycetota bacterium]